MSTAGRINKSGPRFVPKRKNPPASASRPSREGSVASSTAGPTPKPPPVGLPPLGEDPIEEEREPDQPTQQQGTTAATLGSTAPATATATVGTSFRPGASFFAPSDPTAASSSQASTSNALGFTPSSSAPFSTGNSGYTATQATSFGAPTQPPSGSKSPQRPGSLFLPDPETSPRPASAAAPSSSSPTRGTAFSVSNVPPTQLSPSRRAVELQPERLASPPPPPPVAPSGGLPRKRKAQPANDAGEGEEGSSAEAASLRAKSKGKGKEKASHDEPPAKRAASTAGKKRSAPAPADSDAEADDAVSDGGVTEPGATGTAAKKPTTRPKMRRPASRRRTLEAEEAETVAAPAIVSTQAGDAAEESTSDEDRVQPKKRARKRKPAKKGAVDRFLFGGSGDEDDEDAIEADIAVGDAEGSADDGDEQPKKKKRNAPKKTVKKGKAAKKSKKAVTGDAAEQGQDGAGEVNSDAEVDENGDGASPRAESPEPLPPVEPDETTMAVLADPRPKVSIGRPSQRTIFFEEREQRVKAERKKLLKLKRERMKRIKKGLPVTDDENEGDQTPAAAANRNGDGAAGSDAEGGGEDLPVNNADDEAAGGGEDLPVNNADDEAAGGVDQRFRLPSLGADDDDDAAAENGGPFSGLDAINAAMAARGENEGGSGDEDGGNGDEDEEDDAGFQETEWAPQMRIVDGQLVLDESSLQVERGGNTQQIINREVVEESAQDRFVNSSTYSKRKGGARWSKEETEMFYDAISQFYTNFEMIALLFPHRTRHEIRRKFNREDKLNPKLITAALARRKRVDIEAIAKITGADLSGPVPEDPMDEVNRRRAEIEANGGVDPEQQGGRKRKGKGKKEEGGEHDDDAAVLGAGRKRKGKKGAAGAAVGFMPGEEDEGGAEDGEEEDEELLQIRLEMEEEARQRRIDEMEAAGAGA